MQPLFKMIDESCFSVTRKRNVTGMKLENLHGTEKISCRDL